MTEPIKQLDESYRHDAYGKHLAQLDRVGREIYSLRLSWERVMNEVCDFLRKERKELRQEISRRYPGEKLKFSDKVISVFTTETGAVLRWTRVWRKSKEEDPSGKIYYTNVKSTKGVFANRDVLKGAHPDEHELLRTHNEQVRALKEGFERQAALRVGFGSVKYHAAGNRRLIPGEK